MRILIVEDAPDVRATLKDLLELHGHEVLVAEGGKAGVALAAQRPDFIICDVQMPELDGHGVLAAIKQMPGVCDVPFVFLTARTERTEQREGMALGADDYITKPFAERDILDAIAARTKRHRDVRARIQQLTEHHRREINAHWSHELLTPLNAVIGSLELLDVAADAMSPTELRDMLALIREGAERQERLARKLIRYFTLEQVRHGAAPTAPQSCAADAAINAGAAQAARESKRAVTLTVSAAAGDVALHDEWLRSAIYEVVANALTFSPLDRPVIVDGAPHGAAYRIEIADDGPGMTAEQRAQVAPFTQFERHKREQQGLGLGLAIAQTTAKLAGGTLSLEPGAEGRGLRVIFLLPLAC